MPGGVGGLGREPHPTRLTQDLNPGQINPYSFRVP